MSTVIVEPPWDEHDAACETDDRERGPMLPLTLSLSTFQSMRGEMTRPRAHTPTTEERMIRPFLFFMIICFKVFDFSGSKVAGLFSFRVKPLQLFVKILQK